MPKTTTKPNRLQQAHDKLQDAVAEIVSGDEWKRMLQIAARFHNYGFNNQLMIFLQRPDARLVAGFRRWRELGRSVRKGEKGIAIFAPCRYKVTPSDDGPSAASSAGNSKDQSSPVVSGSDLAVEAAAPSGDRPKTEVVRGFRIVYVFDISQTDGDSLEDLDAVRAKLLDSDAPEGIWDALVAQTNVAGFGGHPRAETQRERVLRLPRKEDLGSAERVPGAGR